MPASDDLFMLQMSLDPRQLASLGIREKLPREQDDLEYLVHAHLAALFGEGEVQPFRLKGEGARVWTLGYAGKDGEELRRHADTFAEPADHAACDWSSFRSKRMPATWESGQRLGFEIRACPVVRLAKAVEGADKEGQPRTYKRGAELDAWLHRRFVKDPEGRAVRREEVYADWLADRLAGAAAVESAAMEAFRRRRLVRKRQPESGGGPRKSRVLERPEAILHGTLKIEDGERFADLLRRGIGRHRAFGFGMLLLRPPG